MEQLPDKSLADHLDQSGRKIPHYALKRRHRVFKAGRLFMALIVVVCLILALALTSLYFLVQGESEQDSILHTQLENTLHDALGKDFGVQLGRTHLDIGTTGLLSLATEDLVIYRSRDKKPIATLGKITVGTRLLSTLSGNPSFDDFVIENIQVDGTVDFGGKGFFPSHLKPEMDRLGSTLASISKAVESNRFDSVTLKNIVIVTNLEGDEIARQISIPELSVSEGKRETIDFVGNIQIDRSSLEIIAQYRAAQNDGHRLVFNIAGLDMRTWLPSPLEERIALGSDANLRIIGNLPFAADNTALSALLAVESSESTLNIANVSAPLSGARLNLGLYPKSNHVEIERSDFKLGDLKSIFSGTLKPADADEGFAGIWDFTLDSERSEFVATMADEKVLPFSIATSGRVDLQNQLVHIDIGQLIAGDGKLEAVGSVGIGAVSPALKMIASTEGISVVALKQLWPMSMGPNTRKWLHEHVYSGWISSGALKADVPEGILGLMRDGKRFKKEHFKAKLNIENGKFQPFGKMPNIVDANATISLDGMELEAKLKSGAVKAPLGNTVKLSNMRFHLPDFANVPGAASADVTLSGSAPAIASIAQLEPLKIMDRLKMKAKQLSGQAVARISTKFPLKKQIKDSEIKWNAGLDLKAFSSSAKFSGRKIEKANLKVVANNSKATIKGSGGLDGVPAKFDIVQPVAKNSKVKSSTVVTATLDERAREKLGIKMDPVIKGTVFLRVEQSGKGPLKQFLDLSKASISLPWLAWNKGAGVKAKAEFVLDSSGETQKLSDFKVSGPSFGARGSLVFDKVGLKRARLTKTSLNAGDNFAISIDRSSNIYKIAVDGQSIDARSLINTVIHEGSFKKGQGSTSVDITANVAKVVGFQKRFVSNVVARYSTRKGLIQKMNLKGVTPQGALMSVFSTTTEGRNSFDIRSDDAGHSLGFVNIYTKMRNGVLRAKLSRTGIGPYRGDVRLAKFEVFDEPKLQSLVTSTKRSVTTERGQTASKEIAQIEEQRAKFKLAEAVINKGEDYLRVEDGFMRGAQIGMTFGGTVYDNRDRMKISGTFMPAFGISQVVSSIPIIGLILGGKKSGLIGITYRLRGPTKKPTLDVNPMSIVAPGIFNKVFEFKN